MAVKFSSPVLPDRPYPPKAIPVKKNRVISVQIKVRFVTITLLLIID
jgi:hypothetical protein